MVSCMLIWSTVSLLLLLQPARATEPHNSSANNSNASTGNQLGELVAIGAISLLEPAESRAAFRQQQQQAAGRLVDRIASPMQQEGAATGTGENSNANGHKQRSQQKLDYIVEFMRANKLGKFCDLLTSSDPKIRLLNEQLNSLDHFTLFVPTNEALLLMQSGQLELLRTKPDELRQFLLEHATSELVVPKLSTKQAKPMRQAERIETMGGPRGSTSLVYSLANSPMRVTTAAVEQQSLPVPTALADASGQSNQTAAQPATRLELIVNGANIIAGQSYALQEPNNASATYAIVHLIDRSLYPAPKLSLRDKLRLIAPKMVSYFERANDAHFDQLLDAPEQSGRLVTVFAPNDDAFNKATPAKLLEQLDSNRTFLQHFLRNHILDGLYYSGQLANERLLSADSALALEFESKSLQSRSLVLVNSIPIIEADLMALNGVVHILARPIFERHLLEECHCGNKPINYTDSSLYERLWPNSRRTQSSVAYELDSNGAQDTHNHRAPANWFKAAPELGGNPIPGANIIINNNNNELELLDEQASKESSLVGQRVRAQRSGSLVERNNRDFYRPSAAPANLLLAPQAHIAAANQRIPTSGQIFINRNDFNQLMNGTLAGSNSSELEPDLDKQPRRLQQAESGGSSDWQRPAAGDLFELERYKVLNATSRQRMREQQRAEPSQSQFAYDRPLSGQTTLTTTATTSTEPSKRLYASLPALLNTSSSSNWATNSATAEQLAQAAASRQQRLLKFQAEDARDPPVSAGSRLQNATRYDLYRTQSFGSSGGSNRLQQQQQLAGKTVAPGGFGGCAFYDTECKRLMGKLVRLPSVSRQQLKSSILVASASNQTSQRLQEQHLDATFGETTPASFSPQTSQQPTRSPNSPMQSRHQHQQLFSTSSSFNRANPPRISALNQPLPPWSEEEHRAGQPLSPNWRAQESDIARIRAGSKQPFHTLPGSPLSSSHTSSLWDESKQQQSHQSQAKVLLVPVKAVQEVVQSFGSQVNLSNGKLDAPILFAPASTSSAPTASGQLFANSQQQFNSKLFHTPTPYSVSPITTHLPPMFHQVPTPSSGQSPLGRLTNFTALENVSSDFEQPQAPASNKSFRSQQAQSVPLAPSAHRKQRIKQQQQLADGSGDFLGEKRKSVVRLQPLQSDEPLIGGASWSGNTNNGPQAAADISITSARLGQQQQRGQSAGSLATQASNQVNANFVRSVPVSGGQQQEQSVDFFQNRTIAEIMEDSGLRIDGQQVTFGRLKECLKDADLLNLVTQTGNSLTIFMPTDSAFQRLIQQQAIAHQRERQLASSSASSLARQSVAARLMDPSRRYLIPLIARRPQSAELSGKLELASDSQLSPLGSGLIETTSPLNTADRLTLDCSSNQVRQLLLDHLSAGLVTPKQLQQDMGISSLSGRQLIISSVPSKKIVVVDGQAVIAATRAKNGMVYVVNKFLNLTQQVPNVVDLIETQPNLTTFLSYLSYSSLTDRLKREIGPLTILAPTNEAFEQLSPSARQLINSDSAALIDVLRGHIVEGAQFGKLISMRNKLKTMNSDQNIEAKVIKPNVYLLDNQMTSMRLVGTTGNGVVNAIDRLIVPPWLKISMGANAKPAMAGESAAGSGLQALNLANIGLKPVRFEQAAGSRLTGSSVGSSSSFSLNNNLLDFDLPSTTTTPISTTTESPILGQTNSSPFLRIANNSLNGGGSSSSRFSSLPFSSSSDQSNDNQLAGLSNSGSLTSFVSSNGLGKNVTKNMQLIEKLANLMQARKFVRYLLRSRVSESLKPDMNYVILIPTDQAIEKLPRQIIEMLERDPERLADLVNYHVLDTTFEYINTIPDGQTLNTLNEKDILFNWHRNNTVLTASGAVVMGGVQEENIALLIVDRVLYPTPGDILNIVSKSPILSNFTSLIKSAGLEQQLSMAGPYTLFAPSDFAFNQLDKRDLDFLQRNRETARRFLLRHLSQPAVFTSSIALSTNTTVDNNQQNQPINRQQQQQIPFMMISNSLGEDLTLRQRKDYFSVNDVNFSYADVAATNGVVHVIDGLL